MAVKKIIVLFVVVAFAAGLGLIFSDLVAAKDKPKEEKKVEEKPITDI